MIFPGSTLYCDGDGGLKDVWWCKNERVAEMPTIPLQGKNEGVKRNSHNHKSSSETPAWGMNFVTTSKPHMQIASPQHNNFVTDSSLRNTKFLHSIYGMWLELGSGADNNRIKPDWKMKDVRISNRVGTISQIDYV